MPLGLGLGLGIGKGNIYPPVSAFPTVDAIPPGALVLDSDGVVNECRWGFHNEGTDYINLGRPASVINLLDPSNAYKVCALCKVIDLSVTQVILALGGGTAPEKQLQISIVGGYVEAIIGGVVASRVNAASFAGKLFRIDLIKSATDVQLVLNGTVFGTKIANGTSTYAGNLYIGGRTDGVSANFEGDTIGVKFYNVNGTLVDAFDPNRDDLWDGGATGTTVMGAPFTVSDGTPTGCRTKVLVPLTLLCL